MLCDSFKADVSIPEPFVFSCYLEFVNLHITVVNVCIFIIIHLLLNMNRKTFVN